MTDTDGRLLTVQVHAANIQDRDGAKPLLRASRRMWCFVQTVFADGGYAGKLITCPRCLVPQSRDATVTREGEEALWQAVFMVQPGQRREFEPSSKRRKKRPAAWPSATA